MDGRFTSATSPARGSSPRYGAMSASDAAPPRRPPSFAPAVGFSFRSSASIDARVAARGIPSPKIRNELLRRGTMERADILHRHRRVLIQGLRGLDGPVRAA